MKATSKGILSILHVISWIIFLGLCFKTGTLLFSSFFSVYVNPEGAKKLYLELNLSNLYDHDPVYYIIVTSLLVVITALEALIFYLVIKIFLKINYVHPFSKQIASLISGIGYISLIVGILCNIAKSHVEWLIKQGVSFPDMNPYIGAGSEFILFAGVIFFIAQIFKRGMEIQSENELTV